MARWTAFPYTAKDSYLARGLTAAAGSPAFADLVAQHDAFAIERLRDAGAILIGLTNMPPMANGGMQRGLYGRAESPYNADYLTAAFGSGSSNGSGTATAASFCAFGLGEETWSSGRAPASNNALCAYTPSRGVISVRGNWPLVPTMDVVVPHTRTMADLLEVLDVIVADDAEARGDFWRSQPWIALPRPCEVRPASYPRLRPTGRDGRCGLAGRRFGVPRMYVNADPDAGTAEPGAPGDRRADRAAHRDAAVGDRAVRRHAATSRPPAPRSSTSTSPWCPTTRATGPARRRSPPAGWCPPRSCAARSSTSRPGRGTTSSAPTATPR